MRREEESTCRYRSRTGSASWVRHPLPKSAKPRVAHPRFTTGNNEVWLIPLECKLLPNCGVRSRYVGRTVVLS